MRTRTRTQGRTTGLGRFEDKLGKNALIADKTPGTEILQPRAFSGDDGLTLVERAPCGVILAVTPCTNPTETILCNAICMLAGGNAVVFNVHPAAARVSNWFVHLLSEAILAAGGPRDLIVSLESPSIDSAKLLMNHPGVDMVVVTGGGGVIRQALQSGKRVIAAGPGNPPAVVDETANLDRAAAAIIKGCATDNHLICAAEKAIIAEQIGLGGHGSDLRLLLCEVDEQHPFVQHELLMPVIGLARARDAAGAIAMALRVEHGYRHTVVMHSTNIVNLSAMGRVCGATIYVMNDWHMAGMGLGGEGYTSCTIATTTGEGLTTALNFTRERRCALKDAFRFV